MGAVLSVERPLVDRLRMAMNAIEADFGAEMAQVSKLRRLEIQEERLARSRARLVNG